VPEIQKEYKDIHLDQNTEIKLKNTEGSIWHQSFCDATNSEFAFPILAKIVVAAMKPNLPTATSWLTRYIFFSVFILFNILGSSGNPKAEPEGSDVSYKVIDSQSPPYFLNTSRSLVYTTLGRTVILVCRVRNLGSRAVSWIRQSDLHILTVGETSYTNSLKFFPTHPPGSDEWNLRITNPGLADSGTYECQINTEPKKSRLYHLDVVISKAKIHGDRDVFVQEGSDVNLTCTALSTPEPPDRVVWRHNNIDLHLSTRGGIAIVTEKRRRSSNLMISRAVASDTGNYSCTPSNAEADTVGVHVLEGTGGLPRANVMANAASQISITSLVSSFKIFHLLAFYYFRNARRKKV